MKLIPSYVGLRMFVVYCHGLKMVLNVAENPSELTSVVTGGLGEDFYRNIRLECLQLSKQTLIYLIDFDILRHTLIYLSFLKRH